MVPPAPTLFSTISVWPMGLPIACAMTRATVSVGPAAEKGTTMVTGLLGYWAKAALANANKPAAKRALADIAFPWCVVIWRARRDSNPRPLASEANTLIR